MSKKKDLLFAEAHPVKYLSRKANSVQKEIMERYLIKTGEAEYKCTACNKSFRLEEKTRHREERKCPSCKRKGTIIHPHRLGHLYDLQWLVIRRVIEDKLCNFYYMCERTYICNKKVVEKPLSMTLRAMEIGAHLYSYDVYQEKWIRNGNPYGNTRFVYNEARYSISTARPLKKDDKSYIAAVEALFAEKAKGLSDEARTFNAKEIVLANPTLILMLNNGLEPLAKEILASGRSVNLIEDTKISSALQIDKENLPELKEKNNIRTLQELQRLHLAKQQPGMPELLEQLPKAGLELLSEEIKQYIRHGNMWQLINALDMQQTSLHAKLKVSRGSLNKLRQEPTISRLKLEQEIKVHSYYRKYQDFIMENNIMKTSRVLEEQEIKYCIQHGIAYAEYEKYYNFLRTNGLGKNKALLYPVNWETRAQELTPTQDAQMKKIKQQLMECRNFTEFLQSNKRYLVRVPETVFELKEIADEMGNCIYSNYRHKVVNGETSIFIVYELNEDGTYASMNAMRIEDGMLKEIRAKYNKDANAEVKQFAEKLANILCKEKYDAAQALVA